MVALEMLGEVELGRDLRPVDRVVVFTLGIVEAGHPDPQLAFVTGSPHHEPELIRLKVRQAWNGDCIRLAQIAHDASHGGDAEKARCLFETAARMAGILDG